MVAPMLRNNAKMMASLNFSLSYLSYNKYNDTTKAEQKIYDSQVVKDTSHFTTTTKEKKVQQVKPNSVNDNQIEEKFTYVLSSNNNHLTIVGAFVIARTNFNSHMDNILNYLFGNIGKIISIKELEKVIGKPITIEYLRGLKRDIGYFAD